jgi:hypothetical protein
MCIPEKSKKLTKYRKDSLSCNSVAPQVESARSDSARVVKWIIVKRTVAKRYPTVFVLPTEQQLLMEYHVAVQFHNNLIAYMQYYFTSLLDFIYITVSRKA